ncbi:MAG: tetratricopeptide repeat protein [Myxococcota bacterium]|nr:tetratricopeptide repeat protein [Myxococcota bacterium]
MRSRSTAWLLLPAMAIACAGNPDRQTLAGLHRVEPDMNEVRVEDGLEQAMEGYREFLAEAPTSNLTPEAMRRLADLQLEREFGIHGAAPVAPPTVEPTQEARGTSNSVPARLDPAAEPDGVFEQRATEAAAPGPAVTANDLDLPEADDVAWAGPEEAIVLYDKILAVYPDYAQNDQVLYQKARAFDELGRSDDAIAVIEELITRYPHSTYLDEVQFRRGEYFFMRRKYYEAELAYAAAVEVGKDSAYFELALYKLGWSLYKQEMHEEALRRYIALLDYKVESGYDFDNAGDDSEEQRVADTYRVISLSFSSLGGASAVTDYFAAYGRRDYEDRVYRRLGDFYFEKRRYQDAAEAYAAFVTLNPNHRSAPQFGMQIVEIYEAGGFPKLVLESKKEFAERYALDAEYWSHVAVDEAPEVVAYLRENLEDLATHHHAVFQDEKHRDERPLHFAEASRWYRAYLKSFASEATAPGVHHRFSDLLLENENFAQAALEYEHTAYSYDEHEKAPAAGYAAIYAHRENEKRAEEGEARDAVRRDAVTSTLRFVESFPEHEHAAVVLGAAVDDLYAMEDYVAAIERGEQLIERYPDAEPAIVRAAWAAVAHSYFDTQNYADAEAAYGSVLEWTNGDDPARANVTENLAAAIYKQGEAARTAGDHRVAADHFLRVRDAAPQSAIRPAAEYDAGASLIALEDWAQAAEVLEAFRGAHPEHELRREATKQIASVYRSAGDPGKAASEYERVAEEAEGAEERREALLIAGELYEEADRTRSAVAVYERYVKAFPEPLETSIEMRFKVASLYGELGDVSRRDDELREIVALEKKSGNTTQGPVRYFAAKSALALAAQDYERFAAIQLDQPFEINLAKKKKRMDEALKVFGTLIDYEVGEATAGATFYIAQVYFEFSRALLESERPASLSGSELVDYEMVLEEEAFPFEEQAIEVHEKNLELMLVGVYNDWIDKSLHELAEMMPGRYAKFEESAGPIASIDEYAYRMPEIEIPSADESVPDDSPDASSAPVESVQTSAQDTHVEAV